MIFLNIPGTQSCIDPDSDSVGQMKDGSQLDVCLTGAGPLEDVVDQDGEDLLVFVSQVGLGRITDYHVISEGCIPVERIPFVHRAMVLEDSLYLRLRQVQRGPEAGNGFVVQREGGRENDRRFLLQPGQAVQIVGQPQKFIDIGALGAVKVEGGKKVGSLDILDGGGLYLWKKAVDRRGDRQEGAHILGRPRQRIYRHQSDSGQVHQKVLLSMWLSADPDVVLIDEPTRGVDVGAKAEIHLLLRDVVSKGKAVIMVSSEMPELMASCDRVMVMYEGRCTGMLDNKELREERLMTMASGYTESPQ